MNRLRCYNLLWLIVFSLAASVLNAESEKKSVTTVSPVIYKQLQRIDELLDKANYNAALKKLKALIPEVKAGSYEKAVILRSMASVYSQQGNYPKAADALKKSLDTQALPPDQRARAQVDLGELYIASGKYKEAVKNLQAGIARAQSPTADQYFKLANAFAQLKQFKKAVPPMQTAIKLSKKPKEAWYKLLLAMQYEAGDYAGTIAVLRKLIVNFPPNKEYWLQLVAMHQQLKQYKKALAVNELAYREGFVTAPSDIINLANMLQTQNNPYRAAELLVKEIRSGRLVNSSTHWEMVANAWTDAREFDKAIDALKKASSVHPTGELSYRLGRLYIEKEDWKNAHQSLLDAFKKGGLKDPGNAQVLFGVSCYELHFADKAAQAFSKAQKYENTRKIGRQWLDYLKPDS